MKNSGTVWKKLLIGCCLGGVLLACTDTKNDNSLFTRLPAEETGIHFSNDVQQSDSLNILTYMYFYNGGGVGIGDINNDGLPDIFLTGNQVSSKLYINKGNFHFQDITEKAGVRTNGWCTGVAMADVNSDGLLDIYVSRAGSQNPIERANLLFINNGNDTFTESAVAYGVADTGYTTQAAFFDYDKDGDVDLYLLTHDHSPNQVNNLIPVRKNGEAQNTDKLLRNNGNGPDGHPTFSDVSTKAGISTEGYGLGVAINDLNNDGWPDIYVSNDFLSNDLLYINNQDGTFSNRLGDCVKHTSYNAMGVDVADYNNDGLPDIVVTDMLPEDNYRQKMMLGSMTNEKFDYMLQMGYEPQYMRNTLQLNRGNGHFSEIGQLAGIDKTDWSWSPLLADFDNDGYNDLFVTNGYLKDITDKDFINFSKNKTMFKEAKDADATLLTLMDEQQGVKVPNYAFRNNHDLTFTKAPNWGLDQPSYSNGSAFGDLDNDGDLDLVVNNINDKAFVYQNQAQRLTGNNYLRISLQGDSLNRMGLGAKLTLRYQGQTQVHEHTLYRGYQSTVDNVVHFGLGKSVRVDTMDVLWSDGKTQRLLNVKANQHVTITHKQAKPHASTPTKTDRPIFSDVTQQSGINYLHKENSHSDLTEQPLLPQTHSALGPSMATGDVDGNGLDDLFIGGSAGNPGTFYMQQQPGHFSKREFGQDIDCEDTGSLFFDADNDGDLDLYVVSGGSEFPVGSSSYQDRLYRNDGKGNFKKDAAALPALPTSKATVAAADFDQDGDLDLFVGGRLIPGSYPHAPQSYILRNEKGMFSNVTKTVCPGLKTVGMVTSALWTDFDNDAQVDLLIVGEWLPITFFKNKRGKLINVTPKTGLGQTSGWWNSVAGGDMDNDGDTDYILGNLGLNTPFKASDKEPLTICSGDLDGSGLSHPLVSWYVQGNHFPWPSREVLLRQMPRLGKKFFLFKDYAKATMDDIISADVRHKALVLESSYFASAYLENLGAGTFRLKPLPQQAQFGPVNGIVIKDVDVDGNLDVLLTGNAYTPDVSIGRYDSFGSLYLKGNGNGTFRAVPPSESGFFLHSDARSLIQLYTGNGNALLVGASNSAKLNVFSLVKSRKSAFLKVNELDAFGILQLGNKKLRKTEFYYTAGYLSQSSRVVEIPEKVGAYVLVDTKGKGRTYTNSVATH